jgi:uncharacterized membrane protein
MKIEIDRKNLRLTFPLALFGLVTLIMGFDYKPVSAFVPFWSSVFLMATCAFVILGFDTAGSDDNLKTEGNNQTEEKISFDRLLKAVIWITAFVVISYFIGLVVGSAIYAFCSMYFYGGKRFLSAFTIAVVLGLCLFGLFEYVLEKELYEGILVEYVFELVES